MCLIAFDQTAERPFSIGWCIPNGQYTMKVKGDVRWMHPALHLIEQGRTEDAMVIFRKEEAARKEERLKKEKSI
jgi:hypothetical protein